MRSFELFSDGLFLFHCTFGITITILGRDVVACFVSLLSLVTRMWCLKRYLDVL